MSSLGMSLLLLVALAVVIALLYNLRQSRPRLRWPTALRLSNRPRGQAARGGAQPAAARAEPHAASAGAPGAAAAHSDAARGEPRLASIGPAGEPTLAGSDAAALASPRHGDPHGAGAAQADRDADEATGAHRAASEGAAPAVVTDRDAALPVAPRLLSEIYDCIVEMPLSSPCAGERLIGLAQRFRRAGAKPVAMEGLPVGADADGWGALAPARQYQALRIGILMVNRHGPLNAMEFSEFVAGVQAIADALAALADTPDMAAVLARARDLDATCAQFDAQIGVNVETAEALGPAQLSALAGPLSVVERGNERYARLGAQGEVVFSVALADVPNRLTFLLDVPRSSPASGAWAQMVEAANACAQRLGGGLVDDGGRPLAESSLAQIGRQLEQRYESLEAIGLAAGSALALRVFN